MLPRKPIPPQPWAEQEPTSIADAYREAALAARQRLSAFQQYLKQFEAPDRKVLVDIKTESSFVKKAARKPVREIHDVLRGAILTTTSSDTDTVADRISHDALQGDYKSRQSNLRGYFGAYHFKIPVSGMAAEIQVMPEHLWVYKELDHNRYDEQRCGKVDRSAVGFSRWLYDTANKEVVR